MQSRLAPSFLPTTAVLEVTYQCNHQCVFCSCPWESTNGIFKKDKECSLQEWKAIIDMLCENGVSNLAFTGGEPLLRNDLKEIIAYAASKNTEHIISTEEDIISEFAPLNLFLISNAKILTPQWIDFFAEHQVHLSLSLPGLTTYNYHTKSNDDKKVLNGFTLAKNAGIATTLNVTVTKKNLFELYETIAAGLLTGADKVLLNRFLPGGRGLQYPQLMLNKDEIVEMLITTENVLRQANRYGNIGTELPKCILPDYPFQYLTVGTQCAAATGFFVIGPSGYFRTCNHSQVNLSHFSQMQMLKTHPYWKMFVHKEFLPAMCNGCNQITECDGGCREAAHVYYKHSDAPDPIFA